MEKEKVYLAGGMKSGWQEKLIERFGDRFTFFNPRDHQLNDADLYTTWDLHHVKKADIVFAYMEKDNPSGFGLTLEVGYAVALNKTIILVDEKSVTDNTFAKRFRIVKESAVNVFNELDVGLNFLNRFSLYHSV